MKKIVLLLFTVLLCGCTAFDPIHREYGLTSGEVIEKEHLEPQGEYACEYVYSGKSAHKILFYHDYEESYSLTIQDKETLNKVKIYVPNYKYDYFKIGDTFNLDQEMQTEPTFVTRTTTDNEKKTQPKCQRGVE